MSELVGLPIYVIIAGVSGLIVTGALIGKFSSQFVDNKKCSENQQCCKNNMCKDMLNIEAKILEFKSSQERAISEFKQAHERAVLRIHERIDEIFLKIDTFLGNQQSNKGGNNVIK